eukprot:6705294-Lingulodinium_polyedra.AAC.1
MASYWPLSDTAVGEILFFSRLSTHCTHSASTASVFFWLTLFFCSSCQVSFPHGASGVHRSERPRQGSPS